MLEREHGTLQMGRDRVAHGERTTRAGKDPAPVDALTDAVACEEGAARHAISIAETLTNYLSPLAGR